MLARLDGGVAPDGGEREALQALAVALREALAAARDNVQFGSISRSISVSAARWSALVLMGRMCIPRPHTVGGGYSFADEQIQ